MSKVLEINNLSKHYGTIRAVDGLNLTIEKGTVFGILGPNGSGKTTTLAILMGIIKQDGGSFQWFEQAAIKNLKQRIGALIEVPYFYPYLSAEKNLKILAEIKGVSTDDIDRVLKFTHLFERRKTRYEAFSLGMKQRLALSSVLLGDPEVIILDEPTNGLDPEGIAEIREIIKIQAAKGKTIIIASHILDEVEKVCTHVAVLKSGKLITQGNVKELISAGEVVVVSSDNVDALLNALRMADFIKNIEKNGNDLILSLQAGKTSAEVSKYAFDSGIMLTKIISKHKSLESQFLELVK